MIYLSLHDAGTLPVVVPSEKPGMDEAYWREADFEINVGEDARQRTNDAMKDCGTVEVRPYPAKFQRQIYVDNTPIYELRLDDGLEINLHLADVLTDDTAPAAGGESPLDLDSEPELDRGKGRFTRELSWQEVQSSEGGGVEWLRLPFRNEDWRGQLEEPLVMSYPGIRGASYALELPENSLFVPFDLTHSDRYRYWTDDGVLIQDAGADLLAQVLEGGRYRVYLRPRKWRYLAQVIGHYAFISWFEYVLHDETFQRAHFDRPPFYPYRHDVITTSQTVGGVNYYGEPRSFDDGVDWQWSHSRNAAALRRELVEAQFYTLCLVKVLIGNSDADITLYRYPPEVGDIVLGIGRVDNATGEEQRIWVEQREDVYDLYPPTVIGQFIVPFSIDGP